jgi:hypothetical protein
MNAAEAKTYPFAVIAAPGYCADRAKVHSRHETLSAARKALRGYWTNIPGIPRAMTACIVERETSPDTDYVHWSAIRDAGHTVHSLED